MAPENKRPQLLMFSVPELDSFKVDELLKKFGQDTYVEVLKNNVEEAEVTDEKESIMFTTAYRVLVWGEQKIAQELTDLLISQDWYPAGKEWAVSWGDPETDWEG